MCGRERLFYMNGADKQRSFVYLRQLGGGRESGYARAEMQERAVRLHIAAQGFLPRQEAWVFAVTQEGIVLLGGFETDVRGQGGTAAQVNRQEYGDMQVLFVLTEGAGGAHIPLAGTAGRTGQVDWEVVKAMALQALHPASDAEQEEVVEDAEEAPDIVQEPEAAEEEEHNDLYDLAAEEEPYKSAERELRTPIVPERYVELPQLLRNAYWPQQLWSLHDLFERFEEVFPFGKEADCAYIRVPLDGTYGTVEHYLVGARVKDGWVTAVGYLIPGTAEKNAGLPGSSFKDGYWQSWQEAEGE